MTLFTTKTCAYCKSVMKYLDSKNIKYDLVDTTDDILLLEPAYKISGMYSVPQLLHKDQVVVGPDWQKINRLIEL